MCNTQHWQKHTVSHYCPAAIQHLKLSLVKNFVKAMDWTGSAFKYLADKFPQLSEVKIKEGVFVGPQIHKFFKDKMSENLIQGDEK